jgi:hypothetical protein
LNEQGDFADGVKKDARKKADLKGNEHNILFRLSGPQFSADGAIHGAFSFLPVGALNRSIPSCLVIKV